MTEKPMPAIEFGAISETPPRSPVSEGWQWVLGVLSAIGFVSLLAFGGFLFLSGSQISEEVAKTVVAEVSDHPVVRHHVGELRSSHMDWRAAMQDTQDNPGKSRGIIVMIGSKSRVTLAFEQDANGRPVTAELILDSGEKVDLDLERSHWPRIADRLAGQGPGRTRLRDAVAPSHAVSVQPPRAERLDALQ